MLKLSHFEPALLEITFFLKYLMEWLYVMQRETVIIPCCTSGGIQKIVCLGEKWYDRDFRAIQRRRLKKRGIHTLLLSLFKAFRHPTEKLIAASRIFWVIIVWSKDTLSNISRVNQWKRAFIQQYFVLIMRGAIQFKVIAGESAERIASILWASIRWREYKLIIS